MKSDWHDPEQYKRPPYIYRLYTQPQRTSTARVICWLVFTVTVNYFAWSALL